MILLCKAFVFIFLAFNVQSQDLNKEAKQIKAEKNKSQSEGEEKDQSEEEKFSFIIENMKPFEYDPLKNRNPFIKPLDIGAMDYFYGPFLKTQTYNLKDYRLKGLIWKTRDPKAIFESPSREEYRLSIKDYIGEDFGFIATIREKEVVVIQTIEKDKKRYSTTKVVFLK